MSTTAAWQPLSEEEAVRRADEEYLAEESTGLWATGTGGDAPPWWVAGSKWVDTVIRLAVIDRAVLVERRFDDTLRGRLVGEIRRLATRIYDRKIWPHDGPLPKPDKSRQFVDWTQRRLATTLADADREMLICTEPEEGIPNVTLPLPVRVGITTKGVRTGRQRGPKTDFETASRVAEIVKRIAPDGNWNKDKLEDIRKSLHNDAIPTPSTWHGLSWKEQEDPIVKKAIQRRLDTAKRGTPA